MRELKKHPEFIKAIKKIKSYKSGFAFSIPFYKMTKNQKIAMDFILSEAEKMRLIESISISYDINLEITEKEYKRL